MVPLPPLRAVDPPRTVSRKRPCDQTPAAAKLLTSRPSPVRNFVTRRSASPRSTAPARLGMLAEARHVWRALIKGYIDVALVVGAVMSLAC